MAADREAREIRGRAWALALYNKVVRPAIRARDEATDATLGEAVFAKAMEEARGWPMPYDEAERFAWAIYDEAISTPMPARLHNWRWEEMPEYLRGAAVIPNSDWLVSYHEAGHVVAGAALGLSTTGAHVCSFPEVPGHESAATSRTSPAARYLGGEVVKAEREVVMYVAGAAAENIVEDEVGIKTPWDQMLGRRRGSDGWHIAEIARQAGVDLTTQTRVAFSAAVSILLTNEATWRTVAAVLREREWVGGMDLAKLTAQVDRVRPPGLLRVAWAEQMDLVAAWAEQMDLVEARGAEAAFLAARKSVQTDAQS